MNVVRYSGRRRAGVTVVTPTAKGTCLAIYSRAVNTELPLGEVLGAFYPRPSRSILNA